MSDRTSDRKWDVASDSATPPVLRHDRDGIATVTMNRPQTRNALSTGMMTSLRDALDRIGGDPAVRVVVLAGAGPAFCSGHDLRELRAGNDRDRHEALFRQCSDLMMTITRLRQPVIARVQGVATAAGCQLVATCDLAVAEDGARFSTPGVDIGLFCSTPMVAVSRALGRKRAMEMLLTGEWIDAAEAKTVGLINRVVPAEALDDAVYGLAAEIAAKSPVTIGIGKEAFHRQIDMDLADAYAYASGIMARNMMTEDAAEGIDAFLQKRRPTWRGR